MRLWALNAVPKILPKMPKTCRICLASNPSTMISPCSCRGTLKYVHPSCLHKWKTSTQRIVCEICNSKYNEAASRLKSGTVFLIVGIRFVCIVATLSYGILWWKLFQLMVYVVGLTPVCSSLEQHHPAFKFTLLKRIFNVCNKVGLSISVSAQTVSLKKNYKILRWLLLWVFLNFVSQYWVLLSVIQDLLFVGLTIIGSCQMISYSFETAENVSPIVNLISSNLNELPCL